MEKAVPLIALHLSLCFSLTGSGSVTVESVQRHSSVRHGNSDDGQMDFSLTAIDLLALKLHLSGVITSNKDRWKELSVHGTHTVTNKYSRNSESFEVKFLQPNLEKKCFIWSVIILFCAFGHYKTKLPTIYK